MLSASPPLRSCLILIYAGSYLSTSPVRGRSETIAPGDDHHLAGELEHCRLSAAYLKRGRRDLH